MIKSLRFKFLYKGLLVQLERLKPKVTRVNSSSKGTLSFFKVSGVTVCLQLHEDKIDVFYSYQGILNKPNLSFEHQLTRPVLLNRREACKFYALTSFYSKNGEKPFIFCRLPMDKAISKTHQISYQIALIIKELTTP